MNIGWGEILVVGLVVVLIVGGRKLPQLGRSVGEAIREFQKALRGKSDQDQRKGPSS